MCEGGAGGTWVTAEDRGPCTNLDLERLVRKLKGEATMKTHATGRRKLKAKPAAVAGENDASVCTRRRSDTTLVIPAGQPDLAALRSVTREWLVPRLVEEFLREHGVELKQPMSVNYENPIPKLPNRGGRGASRRER